MRHVHHIFSRYWAKIVKVFNPSTNKGASSTASGSTSPPPDKEVPPHHISGDLKVPAIQVNTLDDPRRYWYKVQLTEEGNSVDPESSESKGKGKSASKWENSLMDVQCDVMRLVIYLHTTHI